MGVVYRATGPDGAIVALKVMARARPDDPLLRRFEREARIRIDHPNVVKVLDAGVDGDAPWIAFELLAGESLAARMGRGRMTVAEAIDLGDQACRGLGAAHALGLV